MPESQNAFDIAKESPLTNLRTQRTTKSSVIWSYINAQDRGLSYDMNREIFEQAQGMTLADVKKFQEENVKNRAYTYCILGSEKDLDFKTMSTYGKVQKLTLKDIFGY